MLFPALKSASKKPGVRFVPSDRFIWRTVPLSPQEDAAPQVELAVESLGPFPPAQLYWGYLISAARDRALIYAAHRRLFSAEEMADWNEAELVIPDLIALCSVPDAGPAVIVRAAGTALGGVAWDQPEAGPAGALAREFAAEPNDDERRAFSDELAERAGVTSVTPRFVSGRPEARRSSDGIEIRLLGPDDIVVSSVTLPESARDELDVRDRALLAEIRRESQRSLLLWRVLLAGAFLAAAALLLEIGSAALSYHEGRLTAEANAQLPEVQRLEAANTVALKIDDLTRRQFKPLEMLAALNEIRPGSVWFQKVTSKDASTLEIEAQTNNANEMEAYLDALHNLPSLADAESHNQRSRDGITSFVLTVRFKPAPIPAAKEDSA